MSAAGIDPLFLAVEARIAIADLRAADELLVVGVEKRELWMLVVKAAVLACSGVADMEPAVRPFYRDNPHLRERFDAVRDEMIFARYLRNIFVGHLNRDLVAKAVEWRPELRKTALEPEPMQGVLVNLFVLETAINSYVAPDGLHRIFSSETDLVYPPDIKRFIAFLEKLVRGAIGYTEQVLASISPLVPQWADDGEMFLQFMKAGETGFGYIKRPR